MPLESLFSAELSRTVSDEWLRQPVVACGCLPRNGATPHCYVRVFVDGKPALRVDVFVAPGSHCFREEVVVIGGTLFVGSAQCVSAIDLSTRGVLEHELDSYFAYLHPFPTGLLVSSGSSLLRLAPDGRIIWACRDLGVDGVVVHDVHDGVVVGQAELDPHGGWRPFRVSLADGSVLD